MAQESSPSALPASSSSAVSLQNRRALAQLLTLVEVGGPEAVAALAALRGRTGRAHTVGVTGAPGAGKSTLVDRYVGELRVRGDEVGVLAVDPTSPFTGGAILGDRVRMTSHSMDDGVFIRSLATRGHLGGLAVAVPRMVRVLDAAGVAWVVIETVGVGQVEVAIARAADTVVVVVNPGWGDAVQAAKAGLMEIADIFVVNKRDRPGVAETVRDLESMLTRTEARVDWRPPIVPTVATTGEGVDALADAVALHRDWLTESGRLDVRRQARARVELGAALEARISARVVPLLDGPDASALIDAICTGDLDPDTAAARLLD